MSLLLKDTSTGKRILFVNASLLKQASCLRRAYYLAVQGYTSKSIYNDVEFGSAVHLFISKYKQYLVTDPNDAYALALTSALVYYKNKQQDPAFIIKDTKRHYDVTYLTIVCLDVLGYLNSDSLTTVTNKEGAPIVEQQFALRFAETDDYVVILTGTIDDVSIDHATHTLVVRDYKTTSMYTRDAYLSNYRLSAQLMLYRMALDQCLQDRGMSLYDLGCTSVATCIDGIFLQSKKLVNYQRSELFYYTEESLAAFRLALTHWIHQFVNAIGPAAAQPAANGMLFGSCETVYGRCQFWDVCATQDESTQQMLLDSNYRQKLYNPLDR